MSQRPEIRFARADEGYVVRDILLSQHVALGSIADWSGELGPYWLLACYGDVPVGCINVNPGTPVGRIEFLTMLPTLTKRQTALVARDLSYAAMAVLKAGGSQYMGSYIADHDTSWATIAQRRKCVPMEHGVFMMKRI